MSNLDRSATAGKTQEAGFAWSEAQGITTGRWGLFNRFLAKVTVGPQTSHWKIVDCEEGFVRVAEGICESHEEGRRQADAWLRDWTAKEEAEKDSALQLALRLGQIVEPEGWRLAAASPKQIVLRRR